MSLCVLFISALACGDELRNVKVGQRLPPFTVKSISGGELGVADLRGKVGVVVYVSAEQRRSELALQAAEAVARTLNREDLVVIGLTGDVTQLGHFRAQRDRLGLRSPLGLDAGRTVYGALGLIVLPTTIVVDRDGRLAHVISSYKSDHEHVLGVYVRHALGLLGDAELEERLATRAFDRDRPRDRIARRRAAARVLREGGLPDQAEKELRAAIEIDPSDDGALLDLASLLIDQGRVDDAAPLVERVTTTDPDHRRGGLMHGVVLFHRQRFDEAHRIFDHALLVNTDPVRSHYYLGLIAEQRGDQAAAARHFKEALTRLLAEHPG